MTFYRVQSKRPRRSSASVEPVFIMIRASYADYRDLPFQDGITIKEDQTHLVQTLVHPKRRMKKAMERTAAATAISSRSSFRYGKDMKD